jgi:hypothetical protein
MVRIDQSIYHVGQKEVKNEEKIIYILYFSLYFFDTTYCLMMTISLLYSFQEPSLGSPNCVSCYPIFQNESQEK